MRSSEDPLPSTICCLAGQLDSCTPHRRAAFAQAESQSSSARTGRWLKERSQADLDGENLALDHIWAAIRMIARRYGARRSRRRGVKSKAPSATSQRDRTNRPDSVRRGEDAGRYAFQATTAPSITAMGVVKISSPYASQYAYHAQPNIATWTMSIWFEIARILAVPSRHRKSERLLRIPIPRRLRPRHPPGAFTMPR